MLVFGTRPEAIKMCPVVNELKTRENVNTVVCVTGQHRQMLNQVLETFQVVPDYDLAIMKDRQTLFDVTVNILAHNYDLAGVREYLTELKELKPDALIIADFHHFCNSIGMLLSADPGWSCRGRSPYI